MMIPTPSGTQLQGNLEPVCSHCLSKIRGWEAAAQRRSDSCKTTKIPFSQCWKAVLQLSSSEPGLLVHMCPLHWTEAVTAARLNVSVLHRRHLTLIANQTGDLCVTSLSTRPHFRSVSWGKSSKHTCTEQLGSPGTSPEKQVCITSNVCTWTCTIQVTRWIYTVNLEYRGPGPSVFLKAVLEQESGQGFSTAMWISLFLEYLFPAVSQRGGCSQHGNNFTQFNTAQCKHKNSLCKLYFSYGYIFFTWWKYLFSFIPRLAN